MSRISDDIAKDSSCRPTISSIFFPNYDIMDDNIKEEKLVVFHDCKSCRKTSPPSLSSGVCLLIELAVEAHLLSPSNAQALLSLCDVSCNSRRTQRRSILRVLFLIIFLSVALITLQSNIQVLVTASILAFFLIFCTMMHVQTINRADGAVPTAPVSAQQSSCTSTKIDSEPFAQTQLDRPIWSFSQDLSPSTNNMSRKLLIVVSDSWGSDSEFSERSFSNKGESHQSEQCLESILPPSTSLDKETTKLPNDFHTESDSVPVKLQSGERESLSNLDDEDDGISRSSSLVARSTEMASRRSASVVVHDDLSPKRTIVQLPSHRISLASPLPNSVEMGDDAIPRSNSAEECVVSCPTERSSTYSEIGFRHQTGETLEMPMCNQYLLPRSLSSVESPVKNGWPRTSVATSYECGQNYPYRGSVKSLIVITIEAVALHLLQGGVFTQRNLPHIMDLVELTCTRISEEAKMRTAEVLKKPYDLKVITEHVTGDNNMWLFLKELRRILLAAGYSHVPWPECGGSDGDLCVKAIISVKALVILSTAIRETADRCLGALDARYNSTVNTSPSREEIALNEIALSTELQMQKEAQSAAIKRACEEFDFSIPLAGLAHLKGIFSCLLSAGFQKVPLDNVGQMKCVFVEDLTICHILLGSKEAIYTGESVLSRYRNVLSLGALRRCFSACSRSPIAARFCDVVESIYSASAVAFDGDVRVLQLLRDQVWPLIIECRVELKMYEKALALLEAYAQSGPIFPERSGRISSTIFCLEGKQGEDLINEDLDQSRVNLAENLVQALSRRWGVTAALKVVQSIEQGPGMKGELSLYNAVLEMSVLNGDIRFAEKLFQEMRQKQIHDICSFNFLIKGYCKMSPPQLSCAVQLLNQMQVLNIRAEVSTYNIVIATSVVVDDMNTIWNIIHDMHLQHIEVDHQTVLILVKHLKPNILTRDRQRILALLDSVDVGDDVVLFSAVTDACARIKDLQRLHSTVAAFHNLGMPKSVHAYGALIKAYGQYDRVEMAWYLWNEMIHTAHMEPTSYAYSCMFNCLVTNGCANQAIALLNASQQEGREPNSVHVSILIKICVQENQVTHALQLYRSMSARNVECNDVAFNTLINACVSRGDMDTAEEILKDMFSAKKCQPNVITYSTLIKGFCFLGHVHRAYELFLEMENQNIPADNIVYNTLLEGYSKRRMIDEAERLFNRMLKQRISPSSFTLTILIKLYGRAHQLSKAIRLAHELPMRFHFQFDSYVFTALIAACLMNSDVDRALLYFERMNSGETRRAVTGRTFGTMIVGCTRSLRLITGVRLVVEVCSRGLVVSPDIVGKLEHAITTSKNSMHTIVSQPGVFQQILPSILCFLSLVKSGAVNSCISVPDIPPELIDLPKTCPQRRMANVP